jgi:hypothetical protein
MLHSYTLRKRPHWTDTVSTKLMVGELEMLWVWVGNKRW